MINLTLRREREARCVSIRPISKLDAQERLALAEHLADNLRTDVGRSHYTKVADSMRRVLAVMACEGVTVLDTAEVFAGVYDG